MYDAKIPANRAPGNKKPGTRVANRVPGNKPGICYPVFIHFVLKGDFLQASDSENIARRG